MFYNISTDTHDSISVYSEELINRFPIKNDNLLVLGVTGTGKTSFVVPVAKAILESNPYKKGLFYEQKRTYLNHFFRPGDLICTYDSSSVESSSLFKWNMIKEIRQSRNTEAEMKKIADFLFIDLLKEANQNKAWVQSAEDLFIAILRVIIDCYDENIDNYHLINALRKMNFREILSYVAQHPDNYALLKNDFQYDPNSSKDVEITRRCADIMFFFNQMLEMWSGSFMSDGQHTIHDYLHNKYQNLFIVNDLATSEISKKFILYFLKKIKDEKISNTSDVEDPILFCMDEIDKLADSGMSADFGLFQAATLGRESGIQILLSSQSFENLYGLASDFNAHITEGGISGFPSVVAFRLGDPNTITTCQKLFGSEYREFIVLPLSRYDSIQVKHEMQPIVTDLQFSELKTGECFIKIREERPQKVKIIRGGI